MLKTKIIASIIGFFAIVSCGEEPKKTDTEKEAKELMDQLDREMEKVAKEADDEKDTLIEKLDSSSQKTVELTDTSETE